MTLQVLSEKGDSNQAIAKRFGVTEGTIRYHLNRVRDNATDGRRKQLLIDKLELNQVVEHWWHAQKESLTGDRPPNVHSLWIYLVDEYQYSGSYKSVRKYVRDRFAPPKKRPFRRVETPPGAQTQSDWFEVTLDIGEAEPTKVNGFIMTLSHSRMTAVVWSRSVNQLAWHRVHNEALVRLGGVAAVNRIDNLKVGVSRGSGPWGEINPCYQAYARTMGFHVDPHEVRQPQQKGKVERRVSEVKRLDLQQQFDSLDHLQDYTDQRLLEDAKHRQCPVTGKTVHETWLMEKDLLRPLPKTLPEPFDLIKHCDVHKDCTIRFEGRVYAVPFEYAYKTVEVRGCSGFIEIVDQQTGQILKQYPRGTEKLLWVDPTCYEGEATDDLLAPRPLGKMARRLQELAQETGADLVHRRSIDIYVALAEVAR